MRNRREKGTIGFDQEIVERDLFRDLAQVFGFAKGHDPGKRDHEIDFERLFGKFFAAGETVKDSAALCIMVLRAEDFDRLPFGLACVNDHRHVALARRAKLASECFQLHIAR